MNTPKPLIMEVRVGRKGSSIYATATPGHRLVIERDPDPEGRVTVEVQENFYAVIDAPGSLTFVAAEEPAEKTESDPEAEAEAEAEIDREAELPTPADDSNEDDEAEELRDEGEHEAPAAEEEPHDEGKPEVVAVPSVEDMPAAESTPPPAKEGVLALPPRTAPLRTLHTFDPFQSSGITRQAVAALKPLGTQPSTSTAAEEGNPDSEDKHFGKSHE